MRKVVNQFGVLVGRIVLWGVVFPIAFLIVLAGMFLVAARWLIYFLAAVLLMVVALGSKEYMNYFWLAFLIPFFVGGLLDGMVLLIAERWRDSALE
jgi:glucan phosphoethanolaminetransferase (alkaline phosphatase superfamily)